MRGQLKVMHKLPPFFAVPTTAGTGSETTLAAVVSNTKTHEKYAINDPCLRPKFAVLDPELTVGLPPHITSTTGMDALTHAVEAYIGKSNTKSTRDYAEKAVAIIFANLETAYKDGKNINARGQMLLGSFYGGMAFTRAYVGYVHAVAHNLGGMYGIPHGLANAVILPVMLEEYGAAIYPQLSKLANFAGIEGTSDDDKAKKFIAEVYAMNERMNIPKGFTQIKEEDIPTIVSRALKEANPLYPVPVIFDEDRMTQIVKKLMITEYAITQSKKISECILVWPKYTRFFMLLFNCARYLLRAARYLFPQRLCPLSCRDCPLRPALLRMTGRSYSAALSLQAMLLFRALC